MSKVSILKILILKIFKIIKMNKTSIILMSIIYIILGIPLIVIGVQAPYVNNVSNLSLDNLNDIEKFLNYSPENVIATNILPLQKLFCKDPHYASENSHCSYIDKENNTKKFNFGNNANKLNNLRTTCIVVGIILCILGIIKLSGLIFKKKK